MNTENFIMTGDELDDGSLVINFDEEDDNGICNTGGYVIVRKESSGFVITCIDGQGDVVNEYVMSFKEAFNQE
jgi:hypothetical protein